MLEPVVYSASHFGIEIFIKIVAGDANAKARDPILDACAISGPSICDCIQDDCCVLAGASDGADMIERNRERNDAFGADQPVRRLESDHSAQCCWFANRACS